MMIKGFMFIYFTKKPIILLFISATGRYLTNINRQLLMFVKLCLAKVEIDCKYPAYRVMVTRTFKSKFAIH